MSDGYYLHNVDADLESHVYYPTFAYLYEKSQNSQWAPFMQNMEKIMSYLGMYVINWNLQKAELLIHDKVGDVALLHVPTLYKFYENNATLDIIMAYIKKEQLKWRLVEMHNKSKSQSCV